MASQVKVLVAKPDDLNSIPKFYVAEDKSQLQKVVPQPSHVCLRHIHNIINECNLKTKKKQRA